MSKTEKSTFCLIPEDFKLCCDRHSKKLKIMTFK